MARFILASASPRRQQLLKLILPRFEILPSDVDESGIAHPDPAQLVQQLAAAKCRPVAQRHRPALVIGCDTVVDLAGEVLGKPQNAQEAQHMLQKMSGKTHRVHTGVCLSQNGEETLFTETTAVTFWPLTEAEIADYIATGDPFDKAGAYGIQGGAAKFVQRVEGDFFNVMGLPIGRLYHRLREMGKL